MTDGERYVVNGHPGADWVDNIRVAGEATLAHGRRTERVRMIELPPEDARPVAGRCPVFRIDPIT